MKTKPAFVTPLIFIFILANCSTPSQQENLWNSGWTGSPFPAIAEIES